MKTLQLDILVRRLFKCLEQLELPQSYGLVPVRKPNQSYPDFLDEVLEYEGRVKHYRNRLIKINRLVTTVIRPQICYLIPFNTWVNVGGYSIKKYGVVLSVKLESKLSQKIGYTGTGIPYKIKEDSLNSLTTLYIQEELIQSPIIITNPAFKSLITPVLKAINKSRTDIYYVEQAGGFYTVEEGTLLFAPQNSHGEPELEDDGYGSRINWQQVDEMPAEVFPFVLPVIKRLVGSIDNVQCFATY